MAEDFAGQHVLVTGASGFIGGHLTRRLVTENVKVRALARDPARARATGLSETGLAGA